MPKNLLPPTQLAQIQALDALGWNVVPAPHGEKLPSITWQRYQNERSSGKLASWFSGADRNAFIITGNVSGLLVLDCDSEPATAWWRELLGDVIDQTTCVRSTNGHHFYFRIPGAPGWDGEDELEYSAAETKWISEATEWPSRSAHTGEMHWDLRGERTGVIAPPSMHASGRQYTWLRDPSVLRNAPVALLEISLGRRSPDDGGKKATKGKGGGSTRSMLSALLAEPGRGGRNTWVTQVLGHYAANHRRMRDLYDAEAERIWSVAETLPDTSGKGEPYTRSEFDKTLESVWNAEMRKGAPPDHEPDRRNGYLVGTGDTILVQCRTKDAFGSWQVELNEWSDFDIAALGVVEDDNSQRVYDVEVIRARRGDRRRALLSASTLADPRKLAGWLSELGVGVMPPDTCWPSGTTTVRLQRYLESQDPPHFEVVESLGWYPGSDGFVCHEGVIRTDGLHGFEVHKPHPRLAQGWAPYRYGFEQDRAEAQRVLAEVMTFHHHEVCAVFGAWWAACLLKPQITEFTSQFPFMALEAPSESGKTQGFFSMLLALGGNTLGNTNPTAAALRDYLSGNQSGIFWVDDMDQVGHLMELLRQSTGDGAVSKKGEDRTSQAQVRLVNPICLSGESLPIRGQKALVDRAVLLEVPSPTSRRSLRDPDRLQWADIVALRTKYPDLSVFAGWYVSSALGMVESIASLPELVPDGAGGRWGDKMAVLRLGARLLEELAGQPGAWVPTVDRWVEGQVDLGSENTLTLEILPAALVAHNWANRPKAADGRWPATPAFVDDQDTVWFQPAALAQWHYEMKHGRIEQRTETAQALSQQAKAMGLGGEIGQWRKQFRLVGAAGGAGGAADAGRMIYWRLDSELSRLVLARSRGDAAEPSQRELALNDGGTDWAAERITKGQGKGRSGAGAKGAQGELGMVDAMVDKRVDKRVDSDTASSEPTTNRASGRRGVHPEQHRLGLLMGADVEALEHELREKNHDQ